MESPQKSAPAKLLIELWKRLLGHFPTQLGLYSNLETQPAVLVEERPREGPTWCLGLVESLPLDKNYGACVWPPYRMVRVE